MYVSVGEIKSATENDFICEKSEIDKQINSSIVAVFYSSYSIPR